MYKLVTFAGYDNRFGPHIFPIEPDVNKTIGHIKMARPLPATLEEYIRQARPIPGKTQLLIDAMGSGEYYGSNVNGDYFPEDALRHEGPDYGHQTFMHYAFPYKHHVNKDPARAYGEKVVLAVYDDQMHRVLLIVTVDDSKCQDILGDLARNHYWDVSMGCRVPWDECSVCKNRARNRGEYCTHLRYQMNKILPDGRRVFAFNRLPKFFDISFVTIGAEKASHILKKVAHLSSVPDIRSSAELGESYYAKLSAADKQATEKKTADIDKEIPSQPEANVEGLTAEDKAKVDSFMGDAGAVKAQEPSIPPHVLDALADFPLKDIFATVSAMGIDLRPHEFQRIVLVKHGARALAEKLAQHRLVFDETKPGKPQGWANSIANLTARDANEKVGMLLRPYLAERSCYPEILVERLSRMEKRGFEGYNRDSQWYKMTDEEKRKSSGIPGLLPASLALAAGFMVFKRAFPQIMANSPTPVKAIAAHPWLLPMLISAGVGASVGLSHMTGPQSLGPHGTGSGLDGKIASSYHEPKIAGIDPAVRIRSASLAYIDSAMQYGRQSHGDHQNAMSMNKFGAAHRVPASNPGIDARIVRSILKIAGQKRERTHGNAR